jgi:FMN phosphatase YigB (HAD superfamily)
MIYILIGEIKVKNIKWIFFDVGSTLVDESKVYEYRMRKIAIRHLKQRSD